MPNNFSYVGVINSTELNKANNETLSSIENMYLKLNELKTRQKEYELIETIDRLYLEKTINNMYKEQDDSINVTVIRPDKFTNVRNTFINAEKLYATKYPTKKTNKLTLENADKTIYVPEDFVLEAVTDQEYISVSDNDIRCVVERGSKPWVREIVAQDDITEVSTILYIYTPFSITANDYVNEISFSTFPYNSTEVINIQYMDEYNTKKMLTLDTINHHSGCVINDYDISYNKSKNHICLNFAPIKAKVIAISLRQKDCIQNDNIRKFYLGLKNLQCFYNEYQTTPMEFYVDFVPPSLEGVRVSKVDIQYNNDYVEIPIIQIYELNGDEATLIHSDFTEFSTSHKTIRFKFIYDDPNNIPNINKVKIFHKNL